MGKRREPRKPVQLPVRIFGTDSTGRIFSESVTTIDISQNGAKLSGVQAKIKIDELIGVSVGSNKVHFRVKWVGDPGSPIEGQIGLLNLTPDKPLWQLSLPGGASDDFRQAFKDRRRYVRVKCSISAELHPFGQPVIWGKATDLNVGGCFVEMPIALKVDTAFEIAIWLGETKLRLNGEVASSAPGFGVGVRFVNTSPTDRDALERHVASLM